MPDGHRWLLLALALGSAGCLRGPTCAEDGCPAETVCDLDGTCRALASTPTRARDQHLRPIDFGGARRDQRRARSGDTDELLLGGYPGAEIFVAFELPEAPVRQAVLVLHPAEGASGGERQTLRVARVRPFEGARVSHVSRPLIRRLGPARTLHAVPDRPIRFDVTSLTADAGPGRVYLAVTGEGDGVPWRIASPIALDARRAPRLELRIRTPATAPPKR